MDMFDLSLSRQKCHVVLSVHHTWREDRSALRDRALWVMGLIF